MANQDNHVSFSPTVTQVIIEFLDALKADEDIPEKSVEQIKSLLEDGNTPKPDEIVSALFESISDDKS